MISEQTDVADDEWISAAKAVALLDMSHTLGARTICKRAHAGLIKTRAERLVVSKGLIDNIDKQSTDNVEIPLEFWWAEGREALNQNWISGDFDTWIDRSIHVQVFGVTFRRLDIERLRSAKPVKVPVEEKKKVMSTGEKVFIGHGRSLMWRELKDFLQDRLHLNVDEFNSVPIAGVSTVNRLEEMLANANFAFLVLTAEDEQVDERFYARLNVIHEAGLFQGRLGFKKAIILLEDTCEEFSNIHGLGQIRFPKDSISKSFEDVRRVLEREKLISMF